jgi:RecJ-like exonuclease
MRDSDTQTPDTVAEQEHAPQAPPVRRPGFVRRLISRLTADTEELDDEDLKAALPAQGATPIAQCHDREAVCILGTLRTVTFRPRAGVPALQAELWDGTGAVTVVWLGRRSIPGIDPGRAVKVRGRITALAGQRVIYNPVYELRPGPSD